MFYYVPIRKQIELLFEKKVLPVEKYSRRNKNSISDVKDSLIYEEFLHSIKNNNLNSSSIYTFTLNTDGISLCDKSNLSIWPVFIAINEIDIESRFYLDNTIIAGFTFKFI